MCRRQAEHSAGGTRLGRSRASTAAAAARGPAATSRPPPGHLRTPGRRSALSQPSAGAAAAGPFAPQFLSEPRLSGGAAAAGEGQSGGRARASPRRRRALTSAAQRAGGSGRRHAAHVRRSRGRARRRAGSAPRPPWAGCEGGGRDRPCRCSAVLPTALRYSPIPPSSPSLAGPVAAPAASGRHETELPKVGLGPA